MGDKFFNLDEVKVADNSVEGMWMDIDYFGQETGMKFKVVGSYSDQHKKFLRKLENTNNKKKNIDIVAATKLLGELAICCVVDWEGVSFDGKAAAECNEINRKKLFRDVKNKWILTQVTDFINDETNFS